MDTAPWSNNQLKRLGRFIRETHVPSDFAPSYSDVQLRYAELATHVQAILKDLDWRKILGHREFEVTSRAKTIDTLRDKLRRDRSTPLSNVQDIAGVRFEAEMTLSQQYEVAVMIAQQFDQTQQDVIHDLRSRPQNGYRAVHVWLRLPERVEVQVRTRLQSAWANAYEELGDFVGREIRYGGMPKQDTPREVVLALQALGCDDLRALEERKDSLERKRKSWLQRQNPSTAQHSPGPVDEQLWQATQRSEKELIDKFEEFRRAVARLRQELDGGEYDRLSD